MEIEGFYDVINIIYIAKVLYNMNKYHLVENCLSDELHYENYYEDMYTLVPEIFNYYESDYYEKRGFELSIYSSKEMEDFYILAGKYGKLKGLEDSNNPYIISAENEARNNLSFSYSLSWMIAVHTEPKRPFHSRLALMSYDDDYVDYGQMALGLINLQDFYERSCIELHYLLEQKQEVAAA